MTGFVFYCAATIMCQVTIVYFLIIVLVDPANTISGKRNCSNLIQVQIRTSVQTIERRIETKKADERSTHDAGSMQFS